MMSPFIVYFANITNTDTLPSNIAHSALVKCHMKTKERRYFVRYKVTLFNNKTVNIDPGVGDI